LLAAELFRPRVRRGMPLPPAEGAGQEGDEWRRPRPRRRDDGARPELALAGVEDEAVRGVCVYFQDVNRAPNVEAITLLVCGEIVDDVLGVREVPGPVVARHGHARHVGETRGGRTASWRAIRAATLRRGRAGCPGSRG